MKVFSKEKYKEVQGIKEYKEDKEWVDELDGKPLEFTFVDSDGMIGDYFVAHEWMEDRD